MPCLGEVMSLEANGNVSGVQQTLGTDLMSSEDTDSLDSLLGHLQGNGPKVMADAGLARLRESRLSAIQRGAESRAEDCLHDVQCLSRLLSQLLLARDMAIRSEDLAATARHICQLVEDHGRWSQLAQNAATYRTQRAVAIEVARRWTHWARHWNEWPQPN